MSFPTNPNNSDIFTENGITYQYDLTNKLWKKIGQANINLTTLQRSTYKSLSTSNAQVQIFDTDLKIPMMFFPSVSGTGNYAKYENQTTTQPPLNPSSDGQIFIADGVVYSYNQTDDYWDIVLKDYIRKHEPVQGGFTSHVLNGSELRVNRDTSDNMWISVYQNTGMDTIEYSLDDVIAPSIVLNTGQEQTLVASNITQGVNHLLSTALLHEGKGQAISFVRYGNTIFVISSDELLLGDTTFTSMSTSERLIYLTDITKTKKRFVFDSDLGILMQYLPNVGYNGSFVEYKGQNEVGSFPYSGLTNNQNYVSNGRSYTYNSTSQFWLYDGVAPTKNNLEATTTPTVNDNSSKGYSEGSIWIYNSVTYTCIESTNLSATWISDADIYYFDTWTSAVSAISVAGSTYVNKYISVINANTAPNSGTTYTAPGVIPNPIADGGNATYKILAQGSNYSVYCQKRQIINPIISKVLTSVDSDLPTISGYYTSDSTYVGSLPSGCQIGDIIFYDGSTWSRFQSFSSCPTVILVGIDTPSQICYRKENGSWKMVVSISDWKVSTLYNSGVFVIYNNTLYKCKTTHTSDVVNFDKTKWQQIGGSTNSELITSNKTVSTNTTYLCDISSNSITLSLPLTSTLSTGDFIEVIAVKGDSVTNNVTLDFITAGQNLESVSKNFKMDYNSLFRFIWINSTIGWKVVPISLNGGSSNGGENIVTKSSDFYVANNTTYLVDTSTSPFSAILPSGITYPFSFTIIDYKNTFSATKYCKLNISANGYKLEGGSSDIFLTFAGTNCKFVATEPIYGFKQIDNITTIGTQTLVNKTLVDSTTTFIDNGDSTKKAQLECSNITTNNTRTLSVPDTNLTIDGIPTSWNYNTKYISGMRVSYSNTILQATSTHTSSGSSFITDFQSGKWIIVGGSLLQVTYAQRTSISSLYNGMAVFQSDSQTNYPSGEYVYLNSSWRLMVDNSSTQTLTNKSLDNNNYFVNNADNTKRLNIIPAGNTGITGYLQSNFTGSKILNIPDAPGNATLDIIPINWQSSTQYLTGMRVLSGNTTLRAVSNHTSSATVITDIQSGKWIIDGGGLLSMTQVQRQGISSPYNGMVVFQSDGISGKYTYYNGSWKFEPIISDNSSSNYVDIASMRIQWGTGYGSGVTTGNINLPASFANTNYSVQCTFTINGIYNLYSVVTYNKNTSYFSFAKRTGNNDAIDNCTEPFDYIAIGLKP